VVHAADIDRELEVQAQSMAKRAMTLMGEGKQISAHMVASDVQFTIMHQLRRLAQVVGALEGHAGWVQRQLQEPEEGDVQAEEEEDEGPALTDEESKALVEFVQASLGLAKEASSPRAAAVIESAPKMLELLAELSGKPVTTTQMADEIMAALHDGSPPARPASPPTLVVEPTDPPPSPPSAA